MNCVGYVVKSERQTGTAVLSTLCSHAARMALPEYALRGCS